VGFSGPESLSIVQSSLPAFALLRAHLAPGEVGAVEIRAGEGGKGNVKWARELLKFSRAFYSHLMGPSRRDRADAGLASEIQAVHEDFKGRYGAPRPLRGCAAERRRHGRVVARDQRE
jgi:hypothetical protein